MKYSKPELMQIGDASVLIANPINKPGAAGDGSMFAGPTYDLDE
jgi:hypothetical protein